MRKFWWIVAIFVLLLTGVVGLKNSPGVLDDAESGLQRSVAFGEALYGVLGVLAGVGLWRRRPWSVAISAAWALVVIYVASVASFAFHDPTLTREGTLLGIVSAGISTAVVGALIVWAARANARASALAAADATKSH